MSNYARTWDLLVIELITRYITRAHRKHKQVSSQTDSILINIRAQLHQLVTEGRDGVSVRSDQFPDYLQKQLDLAKLQLDTYIASVKLEQPLGYKTDWHRNLTPELQRSYAKVNWYTQLLTSWLNHRENM